MIIENIQKLMNEMNAEIDKLSEDCVEVSADVGEGWEECGRDDAEEFCFKYIDRTTWQMPLAWFHMSKCLEISTCDYRFRRRKDVPRSILEEGKAYTRNDGKPFCFGELVGTYIGKTPNGWNRFKLSGSREAALNYTDTCFTVVTSLPIEETVPRNSDPEFVPWDAETFPKDRPVWVRLKTSPSDRCTMITSIRSDGYASYYGWRKEVPGFNKVKFDDLLKEYIQHDGSPCGTLKKEGN